MLMFSNSNFSPNVSSEGWDGTYKGNNALSGVYVYFVRTISLGNKSKTYTGDLTVIR